MIAHNFQVVRKLPAMVMSIEALAGAERISKFDNSTCIWMRIK